MRLQEIDGVGRIAAMGALAGLALLVATPAFASARSKNQEGNKAYQEKKYGEAMKRYTEAQLEAPDSPQLHYNLGNVFFRQGELEKAREEYRRALAAADATLDPKAVYNLGNTFFSQQQFPEAVDAYQRTLKLAPKDMDAKRNLELALLKMKQKQQPQNQNSKNSKQDQDKQNAGDPKNNPAGKDQKQEPGSQDPRQNQSRQQDQGKRPMRGGLTKEEAERILGALQEDEKDNLKKRLAAQQEKPETVEKDW
jgi:tetratricopeptide (TPR) repeat protein